MTIVHILSGLPASGKTSLAKTLDAFRFNLDDIRAMMGFDKFKNDREPLATETMLSGLAASVCSGFDVVIDNTHLTQRLPNLYKQRLQSYDVTFQVHDLTHITLEACLEGNELRAGTSGYVPPDVIQRMAKTLEKSHETWYLTDEWMNR